MEVALNLDLTSSEMACSHLLPDAVGTVPVVSLHLPAGTEIIPWAPVTQLYNYSPGIYMYVYIYIYIVTAVEWHCQMPESIVFPGQLQPDFLHNCNSLKASLPAPFCQLDITASKMFKHKLRSSADGLESA